MKKIKPWSKMTAAELREATKMFDKPLADDFFVEPSPQERARHDRALAKARAEAKRLRGRPKLGRGARSVLITIDPRLLKSADAFAKKKKLSRSALFSMSVARAISA